MTTTLNEQDESSRSPRPHGQAPGKKQQVQSILFSAWSSGVRFHLTTYLNLEPEEFCWQSSFTIRHKVRNVVILVLLCSEG